VQYQNSNAANAGCKQAKAWISSGTSSNQCITTPDRSPSIQSRDNPDRWECQEIEGHMAENLIVLPSWYVVEIHNIPHVVNKPH